MYSVTVATIDGHIRTLNLQGSVLKVEKKDPSKAIGFDVFGRYFGISKQFLVLNECKILNDAKCSVVKVFDSKNWVVRGTESGQVLLFKVLNDHGHLVKSWDGHFNSVNCLVVPLNENGFYTAGNDGCICYYSISTLKMKSWNAHSAPIIGLHLSSGISLENALVWSLSLDKKLKMWSSKGELVKSWNILQVPSAFIVNSLENWVFVGSNTGNIFGFSMRSEQTLIDSKSSSLLYKGNDNIPITCLCLSLDEQFLISGNKSGSVKIWDIANQMCLNSLSFDVEIIGMISTPNPLMDPEGIPKINLKKLDKYPITKELSGKIYVESISNKDQVVEDSQESVDFDENILTLQKENADLKVLNANLFKSAMNVLSQKSI